MDFVDHLKRNVDIVKVIGEYLALKKASASRWVGLCPFHTEKTPSFSVNAANQFYYCFGCKASGDVIKFVMELDGLSFYEALKQLAERHGIPMPQRTQLADRESKEREALAAMQETALEAFVAALESSAGAEARAYLAKRGLSPETIRKFQLGYAGPSGQVVARLLERRKHPPELLESSGLILRRNDGGFFDRFRNRLMFPIHNETGKLVGFAGRALAPDDQPKYMNSPETPLYHKSKLLYNLHRARQAIRKAGYIVLVEGYMDVIGLSAAGVEPVAALCGTKMSADQVRMMLRHAPQVVVNLDPDAAGAEAAENLIGALLEENARIRVLELDGGLDPDEYVKQFGVETYRQRLDKAANYFHWLAGRARQKFDFRAAEGRIQGLEFLLPAVRKVPERLERAAVVEDLANILALDRGMVLEHFRKLAVDRKEKAPPAPAPAARPVERMLLNLLLAAPWLRARAAERLAAIGGAAAFETRRLFEPLLALAAAEPEFTYASLDARLEDRDRALLAEMVFADEVGEEIDREGAEARLEACLRALEQAHQQARRAEVKARIQAAQREGDLAEALRLTAELGALERGGGPPRH